MKISILIITYNHENYILDAIESVLLQRHAFETEIILLDDLSTDKTYDLAYSKLSDIKNAVLIRNDSNLGITRNYEKGFSLCKGEYVFVLEGDDYWLDRCKVQKQVEFLERYPYHSMCFHPFIIQEGKSRIFKSFLVEEGLPPGFINPYKSSANHIFYSFTISDLISIEGLIGTFSVCCYRKKWLDQLPAELFNVVSYDWATNLFMAHFGLLGRINTVMAVYRLAENATWSKKSDHERSLQIKNLIPVYDKLLNYKYTDLFAQKLIIMSKNTPGTLEQKSEISKLSDWVPAFISKIIKWVVPPGLLKMFKS